MCEAETETWTCGYQGGKGGWEELGDWDGYIYSIDTMSKNR